MISLGACAPVPKPSPADRYPLDIIRDSGRMRGKRRIRGGLAISRAALFLSAMFAVRCNPEIRTYYERLLDNGKHRKVALTA